MSEEHDHHDGLAQQRQALEQMSQDLTLRLQEMITQQEQRAHEFNATVPHSLPEIDVVETTASYEQEPTYQYEAPPLPPQPSPSYPSPRALPKHAPVKPTPKLKRSDESKEEGSIGPVAIGIIIFIIFTILRSCG